ncbi:hypothetical protein WH95_19800 [Kiloniella litopenaei]|uniref:Uncharacterized protein n=1 Tax=Kiloniella litopenaei TaxID=1549748 RepID=A0A0M2R0M4_9PROT|nr:hypothetical protein [Kiloniella litopenaei]KKJ75166.1 hypothetical protein WH95_19800 [Kiloniella litopenaei]
MTEKVKYTLKNGATRIANADLAYIPKQIKGNPPSRIMIKRSLITIILISLLGAIYFIYDQIKQQRDLECSRAAYSSLYEEMNPNYKSKRKTNLSNSNKLTKTDSYYENLAPSYNKPDYVQVYRRKREMGCL